MFETWWYLSQAILVLAHDDWPMFALHTSDWFDNADKLSVLRIHNRPICTRLNFWWPESVLAWWHLKLPEWPSFHHNKQRWFTVFTYISILLGQCQSDLYDAILGHKFVHGKSILTHGPCSFQWLCRCWQSWFRRWNRAWLQLDHSVNTHNQWYELHDPRNQLHHSNFARSDRHGQCLNEWCCSLRQSHILDRINQSKRRL